MAICGVTPRRPIEADWGCYRRKGRIMPMITKFPASTSAATCVQTSTGDGDALFTSHAGRFENPPCRLRGGANDYGISYRGHPSSRVVSNLCEVPSNFAAMKAFKVSQLRKYIFKFMLVCRVHSLILWGSGEHESKRAWRGDMWKKRATLA